MKQRCALTLQAARQARPSEAEAVAGHLILMLEASAKSRHAALSCPLAPTATHHGRIASAAEEQARRFMDRMRISDQGWREALAALLC